MHICALSDICPDWIRIGIRIGSDRNRTWPKKRERLRERAREMER